MVRVRITVRDGHLASRRTVEDPSRLVTVVELYIVEDESFTGGPADLHLPVKPFDRVAVDLPAWSVGLDDVEVLEVVSGFDPVGAVVGVLGRQRVVRIGNAVVLDLDDFHLVEVDEREQPFDRPRTAVVVLARSNPRDRPTEAFLLVVFGFEPTGRPGIDHDQLEVLDAAFRRRGSPVGSVLTTSRASSISSGITAGSTSGRCSCSRTVSSVSETVAS